MEKTKSSKKILSSDEIATIFSNMDVLYKLNNTFLEALRSEMTAHAAQPAQLAMGHIFINMVQFFRPFSEIQLIPVLLCQSESLKTYSTFVNNFDTSLTLRTSLQSRQAWVSFQQVCSQLSC